MERHINGILNIVRKHVMLYSRSILEGELIKFCGNFKKDSCGTCSSTQMGSSPDF